VRRVGRVNAPTARRTAGHGRQGGAGGTVRHDSVSGSAVTSRRGCALREAPPRQRAVPQFRGRAPPESPGRTGGRPTGRACHLAAVFGVGSPRSLPVHRH